MCKRGHVSHLFHPKRTSVYQHKTKIKLRTELRQQNSGFSTTNMQSSEKSWECRQIINLSYSRKITRHAFLRPVDCGILAVVNYNNEEETGKLIGKPPILPKIVLNKKLKEIPASVSTNIRCQWKVVYDKEFYCGCNAPLKVRRN